MDKLGLIDCLVGCFFLRFLVMILCWQGLGKLSFVAQSAANVVQAGTKEITSKVLFFSLMITV